MTDFDHTRAAICEEIADLLDVRTLDVLDECVRWARRDAVSTQDRALATEALRRLGVLAASAETQQLPECAACDEPAVGTHPPTGDVLCAAHGGLRCEVCGVHGAALPEEGEPPRCADCYFDAIGAADLRVRELP